MLGLVWGSFLNVVALELLSDRSIFNFRRSACITCSHPLVWYDLIPLLSYIMLRGKCRYCNHSISALYCIIEVLSALISILIVTFSPPIYWFGYALISSALIVTIRTDLEAYAVSSWMTLYVVPLVIFMSFMHLIALPPLESIMGALSAYCFLYGVRAFFGWYKGFEGLGLGDVELLAFVGSFLGVQGWWMSLLIACCLGSVVGIILILATKGDHQKTPIAFCPFIAGGAWIYLFFGEYITYFFV